MSPKLVVVVVSLVVLGLVGYSIKTNLPVDEVVGDSFDFGDAPDGQEVWVRKTDEVWLGDSVTVEKAAKLVDADEADDGVKLDTNACKESTAYFLVRLKNPGPASGTVYLNLYADWNKDGQWSGSDECGAEWAVQNLSIDPGKQTEEIAVYTASFTAGKNTEEIWYRGAVTVGQQMNESATGEFAGGEIEDYSSAEIQKEYWLYCDPYPLVLNHGDEKTVTIKADPFSEKIKSVALSTLVKPDNDIRKITQNGNSFTYKSKKVDGPKRDEPDGIAYTAEFTDGEGWWSWCPVTVRHDELPIKPPIPTKRGIPVPTQAPQVETESGGQTETKTETHPIQEGVTGF